MCRLCRLCGKEIPDNVPLSVYNQIIDKCEHCYLENTPLLDVIIPKSKVFSKRIKKEELEEETNAKIEDFIEKIQNYKNS